LFLGLGGVAASSATAEPDWRWSHPLPHGNNVADLVHLSGRYVHVTDHGGIYTSTNRLAWSRLASGTSRDLRGVAFLGTRLIVTGEEGTVLWSDDGSVFQSGTLSPATTDWLEGVAASTNRAVAVGDNAAIYTSADGRSWSRVTGLSFNTWLSGVAYGGGAFVTVGESGFIASSSNGTHWTRRSSPTSQNLLRVAHGDGRFLVTGKNGVVLTSPDGASWSADAATGTTNSLLAAALAPGERLAVGESSFLLRKPPALWQDQTSGVVSPSPVPAWTYAAAIWDGFRFLAGGRTGVFVESFRTNATGLSGETFWFRNDESPRNWLWDVARFGGTYLAVGDVGTVLSSANGVEWTPEGAPVTEDVVLYGIGGSADRAVAVGSGGTVLWSDASFSTMTVTNRVVVEGRTNEILTTRSVSLLGVVWNVASAVTTNTLQGVAWNGSKYVVVGANGTVLTSVTGTNWVRGTISGAGFLSSVAVYDGGFVASGAAGAIYTSADGLAWSRRTSGVSDWIYRVRNVGTGLVAVGQNGLVLTSPDATRWTARASGSTAWLTDVCRVGRFVHVSGTQGTCLRSTNLVDWTALSLPTGKALYGLASDGVQLVTVGAEGVVLRTVADPLARPAGFAAYAHFPGLGTGTPAMDGFVFEGSPEQRVQLQDTDGLELWEPIGEVTLDSTGLGVLGRPAPEPWRFFRTTVLE
jgi:hypothetical protein